MIKLADKFRIWFTWRLFARRWPSDFLLLAYFCRFAGPVGLLTWNAIGRLLDDKRYRIKAGGRDEGWSRSRSQYRQLIASHGTLVPTKNVGQERMKRSGQGSMQLRPIITGNTTQTLGARGHRHERHTDGPMVNRNRPQLPSVGQVAKVLEQHSHGQQPADCR